MILNDFCVLDYVGLNTSVEFYDVDVPRTRRVLRNPHFLVRLNVRKVPLKKVVREVR